MFLEGGCSIAGQLEALGIFFFPSSSTLLFCSSASSVREDVAWSGRSAETRAATQGSGLFRLLWSEGKKKEGEGKTGKTGIKMK